MVWWGRFVILLNGIQFVCNENIALRRNRRREEKSTFVESDSIDPHKPSGLEILVSTSFTNHHSENGSQTKVHNSTLKDVRFPNNPNTYLLMSTVGHQHKPATQRNSISSERSTNRPQSHYSTNYKKVEPDRTKYVLIQPDHQTTQTSSSTEYSNPSTVFKDVIHTVGSFFRAIQTFPDFISGTKGTTNTQSYPAIESSEDEGVIYTPSFYSTPTQAGYIPPNRKPASVEGNTPVSEQDYGTSTGQKWNPAWATLGDVCIRIFQIRNSRI